VTRSNSIRLSLLVLAGCAALSLPACGGGSGGSTPNVPNDPRVPAAKPPLSGALDPSTIALMVGTDPGGDGTRKAALAVDPTGAVSTVVFRDADSHPVAVNVTGVESLGDGFFAVELSWSDGTTTHPIEALWRTSDGRLFDLSAYNLSDAQLKGNDLYVLSTASNASSSYTLYHVDVASLDATLVATPMNNPAYDPLNYSAPLMLVDGDGDVMVQTGATSSWDYKLFFHDNTAPRAQAMSSGLTFCPTGGQSGQLAAVYGEDGLLYVLCVSDLPDLVDPLVRYLRYDVRKVDFTSSGPVTFDPVVLRTTTCSGATPQTITCPESRLSPTTPYGLQSRARYVPLTSGYFTMSPITGGGVSLTWTAKALPTMTSPLLSGSFLYWKESDTIRRIRFTPGSTTEDMVTVTGIIGFKVANGVVIYTRYDSGTSIGTYEVTAPGVAPVRLMSDDMQVQHIVEL
jgi:hypothetical protein